MNIKALFQRSTNNKVFVPEIDGLRFLAIITVVIYHFHTALSRVAMIDYSIVDQIPMIGFIVTRLDIGVKVFFAISGFILALPFVKHYLLNTPKVSLKDYYYRRLIRLEPPFVVTLILFTAVHFFFNNGSINELLPHLGASLIYGHGFIYGEPSIINPVTWSLETEAQFYIVIPLVISLLFWKNGKWMITFFILLFILSIYSRPFIWGNGWQHLTSSLPIYFSNFLIGFPIAYYYVKNPRWFKVKSILWDIIGVVSIISLFYFYKPQISPINNSIFNFSIVILFISAFKGIGFNWLFTRPIIYIIGGMCYSIYLLHYAFFYGIMPLTVKYFYVQQWSYGFNFMIQFLVIIPILLMICGAFYLMFEKPCMDKRWPNKLWEGVLAKLTVIKIGNF